MCDKLKTTICVDWDTNENLIELKKKWKKHNMNETIIELMKRVKDYD